MWARWISFTCCLCFALLSVDSAFGAQAALAASPSPDALWRSQVQSAPGRVVLPMSPQQDVPDMVALGNGDIVVAGTASSTITVNGGQLAVSELLPNGRLDPGFGDGGVELTGVKLQPWQLLAQPDGKILILGPSRAPGTQVPVVTRFPVWQLLRLLPDGTPDPSFGRGGLRIVSGVQVPSENSAQTLAPGLEPDGDIILPTVIGRPFSPETTAGLVRLHPDGSRDTSFGNAGVLRLPALLEALSFGSDGAIVAVMSLSSGPALMRLTADGSVDPNFNAGSVLQLPAYGVDSLIVQAGGAIEMHGYPFSNTLIDTRIWRYTSSGALDSGWGSDGMVDLGPPHDGGLDQLLPASDGGSLYVTTGVSAFSLTSSGNSSVSILRFSTGGQIDPATAGPEGLLVSLPFGGGSYAPHSIANLRHSSFSPSGVIQRANGSLLFNGQVEAAEEITSDAGSEWIAGISGFALAALDPSYRLERAFTAATPFRLTVRVVSTRLSANGIAVRVRCTHAALSVVTVRAAGQAIAKGTVRFFSLGKTIGLQTVRIPLTQAGKRLIRRHHGRLTITVRVAGADLAGNHTLAHTSATLVG